MIRHFADHRAGDRLEPLVHDVTATTVVLGAAAARDWRPAHHDHRQATTTLGLPDLVLATPSQAAWFERYVTDRLGHRCRIGAMTFRMVQSIVPGSAMVLSGQVDATWRDPEGCGWLALGLRIEADGALRSSCAAVVAVPVDDDDNPWRRRGPAWGPSAARRHLRAMAADGGRPVSA